MNKLNSLKKDIIDFGKEYTFNIDIRNPVNKKHIYITIDNTRNILVKKEKVISEMLINPYHVLNDDRLTTLGKAFIEIITEKFEDTFEKDPPYLHISIKGE